MCKTITPFGCSVLLKDSNSSVSDEDDYEDSQAASELQGVKLLLGRFVCAAQPQTHSTCSFSCRIYSGMHFLCQSQWIQFQVLS